VVRSQRNTVSSRAPVEYAMEYSMEHTRLFNPRGRSSDVLDGRLFNRRNDVLDCRRNLFLPYIIDVPAITRARTPPFPGYNVVRNGAGEKKSPRRLEFNFVIGDRGYDFVETGAGGSCRMW